MAAINMKAEVETVLNREVIGYEKLLVKHFMERGMVNPIDIATAILTRHIDNENQRIALIQNQVIEMESELRRIRAL